MSRNESLGNSISPYVLRPPRVFITRDFPEGCNTLPSRVERNENTTRSSLKGKEVNPPTNTTTRAEGKNVIPPANTASSSAVPRDVAARTDDENYTKETLRRFREIYRELNAEYERNRKPGGKKDTTRFDLQAADQLKRSPNWVYPEKRFGHIPGIEIGDKFQYRAELAVVGLHGPYVSGIDYAVARNGKKYATSVVSSGCYENEVKNADVLIYSGQGGQGRGVARTDQTLTHCNLALANSMKLKYPIRVIRKMGSTANGPPAFTYDGLFVVHRYWPERDQLDGHGRMVYKFELHRVLDPETSAVNVP